MCVGVYPEPGTVDEPGAVAGANGHWRVEGGLEGARWPFSGLSVVGASKHEGSMSGLCLASWYGVGRNTYER